MSRETERCWQTGQYTDECYHIERKTLALAMGI